MNTKVGPDGPTNANYRPNVNKYPNVIYLEHMRQI